MAKPIRVKRDDMKNASLLNERNQTNADSQKHKKAFEIKQSKKNK